MSQNLTWSQHEYDAYLRRRAAQAKDRPAGLLTGQQKPEERPALESVPRRKKQGGNSNPPVARFFVTYRIYACQPMDFDNPSTKELQDTFRKFHILTGDDWNELQGRVETDHKVATRAEERTEIEIERIA